MVKVARRSSVPFTILPSEELQRDREGEAAPEGKRRWRMGNWGSGEARVRY